jgi:two-component system cell cycle response regulator
MVALVLGSQIRACDHIARFGGDEFVILLPATDLAGARVTAERCRRSVEKADWGRRRVTVSIGATAFRVTKEHEADLLGLADEALFRAKAAGRNRVASIAIRSRAMEKAAGQKG